MQTSLVVLIALSACDGVSMSNVEQAAPCPRFLCHNSNELSHGGLHELNLLGLPDQHGYTLSTRGGRALIEKDGVSYHLYVKDSRMIGVPVGKGPERVALSGAALVGARLRVTRAYAPAFDIHIDGVRPMMFPSGPTAALEAYRLSWSATGEPVRPDQHLCNGIMQEYPPTTGDAQLVGLKPDEAVVYEGDHFDIDNLQVRPAYEPDWITFGCAGYTLAKMHLLRETHASNAGRHWAGSQATFNLLVGRYCGGSTSLTVPGVPLVWLGGALGSYIAPPEQIEARWDEHGATCIGVPRLEYHPDEEALQWFPDIRAAIAAACDVVPPPCTNTNVYDFDGSLRVSANWTPSL